MKTFSPRIWITAWGQISLMFKSLYNPRCIFLCFAHFKSKVSHYTCVLSDALIGHKPFHITFTTLMETKHFPSESYSAKIG